MISIAMATFNGEKYIEEQLDSILNQTVPADEIIICDDCSSDNTVHLIREIIKKGGVESSVHVEVNDTNLGYIQNFYKAVSLTTGDYIFLADQDDIWHSDKLETMIQLMNETKAQAICSNFTLIDQNGKIFEDNSTFHINKFVRTCNEKLKEIKFSRLVFGNIVQGCTYCFTRQVRNIYVKLGSTTLIHDFQIMFIASLLGKVYFCNSALIDYRIHQNNVIGLQKKSGSNEKKIRKWVKEPIVMKYLKELNNLIKIPNLKFYDILYKLKISSIIIRIWR